METTAGNELFGCKRIYVAADLLAGVARSIFDFYLVHQYSGPGLLVPNLEERRTLTISLSVL